MRRNAREREQDLNVEEHNRLCDGVKSVQWSLCDDVKSVPRTEEDGWSGDALMMRVGGRERGVWMSRSTNEHVTETDESREVWSESHCEGKLRKI